MGDFPRLLPDNSADQAIEPVVVLSLPVAHIDPQRLPDKQRNRWLRRCIGQDHGNHASLAAGPALDGPAWLALSSRDWHSLGAGRSWVADCALLADVATLPSHHPSNWGKDGRTHFADATAAKNGRYRQDDLPIDLLLAIALALVAACASPVIFTQNGRRSIQVWARRIWATSSFS